MSTQHNMNKHWGKADMAAAVAAASVGRNNNGSGNMGNQCPPGVPPNRAGMPPTKMVDQPLWPGNPRYLLKSFNYSKIIYKILFLEMEHGVMLEEEVNTI